MSDATTSKAKGMTTQSEMSTATESRDTTAAIKPSNFFALLWCSAVSSRFINDNISLDFWYNCYSVYTTRPINDSFVRIFSALHGMPARTSDDKAVCPSIRLSVKRVHCDKAEERRVQISIPYARSFSLVFWQDKWLVGATPSNWNFGSSWEFPVDSRS